MFEQSRTPTEVEADRNTARIALKNDPIGVLNLSDLLNFYGSCAGTIFMTNGGQKIRLELYLYEGIKKQ